MRKRPSYQEQLDDPRWKEKRDKIVKRAHNQCQICASKKPPMHVHHSYYEKGKKAWEYPDYSLICVCANCHEGIHALLEFKGAGKRKIKYKPVEYGYGPPPARSESDYVDPNLPEEPPIVPDRFGSIFAAIERVAG